MKLVNVSEKIINIGTTVLMPGETMAANESICELPAIKAFIASGLLIADDSETAFQKAVEEAARKMVLEKEEAAADAEPEAKAEGNKATEEAAAKAKAEAAAARARARAKAKTEAASKEEKSPAEGE